MRKAAPWLVVLAGVAVVAGVYLVFTAALGGDKAAESARPSAQATADGQADKSNPSPEAEAAGDVGPGVPTRLRIPELDIDAPVTGIGMSLDKNDPKYRTLVPPKDPATVGWWQDGSKPGADKGSTLLLGHTKKVPGKEGVGKGAFGRISTLDKGDRVRLTTDKGEIPYEITEVLTERSFQQVAEDAPQINDRDFPGGRIVLITCWYDGNEFTGNTFAIAEPV